MTDRERLEEIERKLYKGHALLPVGRKWLIDTLRGYINRDEAARKIYQVYRKTIREYDKLMLKRRKELDIYNKEHPKE